MDNLTVINNHRTKTSDELKVLEAKLRQMEDVLASLTKDLDAIRLRRVYLLGKINGHEELLAELKNLDNPGETQE